MSKDEAVREDIIKASKGLFQRYGYHKTTMEDIAKAAGKGKSTLYYYFKSKDQIIDVVLSEEFLDVLTKVEKEVIKSKTAKEKIEAYLIVTLKSIYEKAIINELFFGEMKNELAVVQKCKNRFVDKELSLVEGILEYGYESGEFKIVKDVSAKDIAFVLHSANVGLEIALVGHADMGEMIKKIELSKDLFFNGILKG